MQGSYHGGNTASRPISEVKHRWAMLVLATETSLEPIVTLRFCFFSIAPFFHSPAIATHRRGVWNSVVVCCHSCHHKSKIISLRIFLCFLSSVSLLHLSSEYFGSNNVLHDVSIHSIGEVGVSFGCKNLKNCFSRLCI